MLGDIGTEDANRRPYRLHLDLKLRGRLLNGAIVPQTWSEDDYGGAPERRVGNGLSYWTELRKSG